MTAVGRGHSRGGQAKRPKQGGQLGYSRVAREDLRLAVVCRTIGRARSPKKNFTDIERAIGLVVDELTEESGSSPSWLILIGLKMRLLSCATMK